MRPCSPTTSERLTMSFFCLERYGSVSGGSSSWSSFISSVLALAKCPGGRHKEGLRACFLPAERCWLCLVG